MLTAQNAIIADITAQNIFKTVNEYCGEIHDIIKLRNEMPAAYIMLDQGNPLSQEPEYYFDILSATETQVFNKNSAKDSNLQSMQSLINHYRQVKMIGALAILDDQCTIRTVYQDNKFTIIALRLAIRDLS